MQAIAENILFHIDDSMRIAVINYFDKKGKKGDKSCHPGVKYLIGAELDFGQRCGNRSPPRPFSFNNSYIMYLSDNFYIVSGQRRCLYEGQEQCI